MERYRPRHVNTARRANLDVLSRRRLNPQYRLRLTEDRLTHVDEQTPSERNVWKEKGLEQS